MREQELADLFAARTGHRGPWSGSGTSIVSRPLMEHICVFYPDAHQQADRMAALARAGCTELGYDITMPLFSVCHEVAGMGVSVNWGNKDSMPECGAPIFRTADDICIPDDFLERPECATPLRALNILKTDIGDHCVICGKVFGPWTLAYHLFGIENFLIMTIDDAVHVQRILARLVEVTLKFARAQITAGADCLLLADHATRDLCGPKAYEKFLLSIHADLVRQINAPLILHICGNTVDRISMIAQTGVACFHWDTKTGEPTQVRRLAGPNMMLMGGISNFTLLKGTAADVTQQARRAVAAGIDIVGPECAVPLATPLENLRAISPDVAA